MNQTGFNWKKVSIRTNNFDGTHRSGGQTYNVPKAYQPPPKLKPGVLLDMMEEVNHKGPIKHKIVTDEEFEKLAIQNEAVNGKPMVEKTIFIVKPIYVPVVDGPAGDEVTKDISSQKMKRIKSKQQKAIYMERQKPPNYSQSNYGVSSTNKDDSRVTFTK